MKRILITRPRAQADSFAQKLRAAGYEPIFFPVVEIQAIENNMALERALSRLECYDWLVFTSANAVHVVVSRLQNSSLPRVAAIGPKTAQALAARSITPDFVPSEYIAEAILPGLGDLQGRWVLLPRAEIARQALPEAICEAGGIPHEIAVYKTLPAQPNPDGLAALRAGVDVITFTSPSTVQNFAAIARQNGLDPLALPGYPFFACIGPITAQAAGEEGFAHLVTAAEYTTEGLIDVISHLEVS
jgi:uroporphyrinogen III methyltransferase/synthase